MKSLTGPVTLLRNGKSKRSLMAKMSPGSTGSMATVETGYKTLVLSRSPISEKVVEVSHRVMARRNLCRLKVLKTVSVRLVVQ